MKPIVSAEVFARAHRGWVPGTTAVRVGIPSLGVVRCGLCGRVAGRRGERAGFPVLPVLCIGAEAAVSRRRSVRGIERARSARSAAGRVRPGRCRRRSARSCGGRPAGAPRGPDGSRRYRRTACGNGDASCSTCTTPGGSPPSCSPRRKRPSPAQIRSTRSRAASRRPHEPRTTLDQPSRTSFASFGDLDIEEIWRGSRRRRAAHPRLRPHRRDPFYPDHLEVTVTGAPRMNVSLQEVGLTGGSSFYGVGEPTRTPTLSG